MAERLIVLPDEEPVSLSEAKAQAIIETTAYDTLVASKIQAARGLVEDYTGRALVTQTWLTQLDRFPCGPIYLNHPPLQSVTSITYVDSAGDTQTLSEDAYIVDTVSEPGRVGEAYGYAWPCTQERMGAVTIESVHGYDDVDEIPQQIKDAILVYFTDLFQNRESTTVAGQATTQAVESLLFRFRVMPMSH